MKNRIKSIILIQLLLLLAFTAPAQSALSDSLLTRAFANDALLPMLVDSAIKYSGTIKRFQYSESYAQENLKINKKFIYSAVSLSSSYHYGTNYSAVSNPGSVYGPGSTLTSAQTGFYSLGVGIQIPITHIINRKNIIKEAEAQVKMVISERENEKLLVKQDVIRMYQDFKLSHKLLMIGIGGREEARLTKDMAQKEFLNGQITTDQLSKVSEVYNKALVEFETLSNRFQTNFMQLEAYTNTSISTLIKQLK